MKPTRSGPPGVQAKARQPMASRQEYRQMVFLVAGQGSSAICLWFAGTAGWGWDQRGAEFIQQAPPHHPGPCFPTIYCIVDLRKVARNPLAWPLAGRGRSEAIHTIKALAAPETWRWWASAQDPRSPRSHIGFWNSSRVGLSSRSEGGREEDAGSAYATYMCRVASASEGTASTSGCFIERKNI